ncbi:hypothetical protein GP486_000428 [Trichoglossum hirsutum]|uniref:Deoxyribonuclease NucA/NucB domain-containing protein n=1 Tax=Trichoglossum hirsutum TaxID=265104 RepID=A0A9P8RTK2_9PEZI|nr:hypothetical protein GP486_000428 [Trichoglossum hirsutum]
MTWTIKEICTNMCWGAYCTKGPRFGVTFNWDKADKTTKRRRRRSAGCAPNPNRCSTKKNYPKGHSCDEYPFASVKEADQGGQVNRCVPADQNSRQGNLIGKYYQSSCGGNPCQFIVGFGNPNSAGVKYCSAFQDPKTMCVPDGNEFKGNNPDVQPPNKRDLDQVRGYLYMTERGTEVSFDHDLEPGTIIHSVRAINETLFDETLKLKRRDDYDYYDDSDNDDEDDVDDPNLEVVEDKIAYKIV